MFGLWDTELLTVKFLFLPALISNFCSVKLKYRAFSPDVVAAMLVYSQQKNFDDFFCFGNQHGRYVYCLLFLLELCVNALLTLIRRNTINPLEAARVWAWLTFNPPDLYRYNYFIARAVVINLFCAYSWSISTFLNLKAPFGIH